MVDVHEKFICNKYAHYVNDVVKLGSCHFEEGSPSQFVVSTEPLHLKLSFRRSGLITTSLRSQVTSDWAHPDACTNHLLEVAPGRTGNPLMKGALFLEGISRATFFSNKNCFPVEQWYFYSIVSRHSKWQCQWIVGGISRATAFN